jgi:hypothetical protein
MNSYFNKRLFLRDLSNIFRETRAFFLANLFISLLFIFILLFIDIEYLNFLRSTTLISLELIIAIIFVAVQFTIFTLLVFLKYTGSRKSIENLIHNEESLSLEFKSSVRWDFVQKKMNKALEHNILKTVSGFSNAEGGTLLIGVSDEKQLLGLDYDYSTLKRKDKDGFVQHLSKILTTNLGKQIVRNTSIEIHQVKGKDICRIDVLPSKEPVFVSFNGKDEFYIRTGNITIPLTVKEAYRYIQNKGH